MGPRLQIQGEAPGPIGTYHPWGTGPMSAYQGEHYIYVDGTYRSSATRYIIHVLLLRRISIERVLRK